MSYDLAVLGAGPAGVGAAWWAARAGRRVVVLERNERVGGVAGSFEVAGIRVDHGSHRLHPSVDPRILEDLRGLLGADLQTRERRGRIRLAGRWVAFPLRPADLARNLPPGFTAAAVRDALLAPLRRPRADTFAEQLRASLGPTLCERFYFPYARKLWGLEPDEISGEQARRRVRADSAVKLIRRVLKGTDPAARTFLYPRRGYGQLWERMADAAATSGADIRLSTTVERLEPGPGHVDVHLANGVVVRAARVWSTLPITVLVRMAAAPDPVQTAAGRLSFRSMVLAYLVLDRDRYTPYDAHYLPEADTPVTRISEPKNYRDDPDDPAGRTVLCAEIPCATGDRVWSASDGEVAAVVVAALRGAGLPDPEPSAVHVRRIAYAYPVYGLGFENAFATLDAWAASQPWLLTFGRQGLFVHDNAHHALTMARAAADALGPGGSFDEDAWRSARRRFATHVVED